MPPLKDLTGQKFGHLTVIKRAPNKVKKVAWECFCDCGNTTIVTSASLTRKEYRTTTCGCRIGRKIIGEQYGELTIIEDLVISTSRCFNSLKNIVIGIKFNISIFITKIYTI